MITISVCMIVKNEEAMLRQCLESLVPIADEIIIVDTGSTDRTKEIAAEFTDKIYDFVWIDDFAAARNFAFSKATMDYIYTADADELLDEKNIELFKKTKAVLLPEIEIVQMYYLNLMEENTAYNSKRELRPKLYKRVRNFEWINPIHETVRLDPVVFDSDIEIQHLAKGNHAKRDFMTFQKAYKRGVYLPKKLHSMYSKELFIAGDSDDFNEALPFFEESINDASRTADEKKEAACVLARGYRILGREVDFLNIALQDVASLPSSEMCIEIGTYYYEKGKYEKAKCWLFDGIENTEPVISLFVKGTGSLTMLADCFLRTGDNISAEKYKEQAFNWVLPDTL